MAAHEGQSKREDGSLTGVQEVPFLLKGVHEVRLFGQESDPLR